MLHIRRDRVADARGRQRLLRHHLGNDRLHRAAGEGRITDEHLVGHGAQGVHVTARADDALAHRLFRRHVRRGAERHAGLGHAAATRLLDGQGDAEVGDEGRPFLQQDVFRLDVAVDDALAMSVVEGGGDFTGETDRVLNGELLLAGQAVAEGLARHVGHDVVEEAVGLAGIDQPENVRVLEIGGDLDFGEEAFAADHGAQLGVEHLDGDSSAVLQVLGEVDGCHAARAELPLDPVAVGEGRRETGFRASQVDPSLRSG
jgi:hypothetical protein